MLHHGNILCYCYLYFLIYCIKFCKIKRVSCFCSGAFTTLTYFYPIQFIKHCCFYNSFKYVYNKAKGPEEAYNFSNKCSKTSSQWQVLLLYDPVKFSHDPTRVSNPPSAQGKQLSDTLHSGHVLPRTEFCVWGHDVQSGPSLVLKQWILRGAYLHPINQSTTLHDLIHQDKHLWIQLL